MSTAQSTTGVIEKVSTKYLPNPLKEDQKPELGADLNAHGFSLKGVKDVECQTINGKDLDAVRAQEAKNLLATVDAAFAKKDHVHPEFKSLRTIFDGLLEVINSAPTPALKDHQHSIDEVTGTIPLARLEKGHELGQLLKHAFAEADHRHHEIELEIRSLQERQKELKSEMSTVPTRSECQDYQSWGFAKFEDFRQEILKKVQEQSQKGQTAEPTELIGVRRVHVPKKCHHKKLTEIAGRDESGTPVKVTLTRSGKEITVGDTVTTDDILLLSPASASVRLLFS